MVGCKKCYLANLHICRMASNAGFGFPKAERLKRKKLFEELFSGANRALHHPVMAVWKETTLPEDVPAQVGFSVPKKHYKRAVVRNLIKRRLREVYRLNKYTLHAPLAAKQKQLAVLFVTLKTDDISYEALSSKMVLLLRDIAAKIEHGQ